jgi:hypothetical protein
MTALGLPWLNHRPRGPGEEQLQIRISPETRVRTKNYFSGVNRDFASLARIFAASRMSLRNCLSYASRFVRATK